MFPLPSRYSEREVNDKADSRGEPTSAPSSAAMEIMIAPTIASRRDGDRKCRKRHVTLGTGWLDARTTISLAIGGAEYDALVGRQRSDSGTGTRSWVKHG
jgi:hypothetical protein